MALTDLFTDIADAIREKDGTTETIPAMDFPARVRAIPSGGGKAGEPLDPVAVYNATRPADWLPMPEPEDNEIFLLVHIPDGASSLLAFTVTCAGGNYSVMTGTVSGGRFIRSGPVIWCQSGKTYETELQGSGTLTSTGMRQCMVKIGGTDLLTWEPAAHSKKTAPSGFADWNIVEIACRLPKGTKVKCGGYPLYKGLTALRYFAWYGENQATSIYSMFCDCHSLIAVLSLDTSRATQAHGLFIRCYSLSAFPQLDTSRITTMNNMFSDCSSLTAIPPIDTSKVADMAGLFNGCKSLISVPLMDTSHVNSMSYMFKGCCSLSTIPELDTSQAIHMNEMFSGCSSLTTIPALNSVIVQNMENMFADCGALATIPLMDISNVVNRAITFDGCNALSKLILQASRSGLTGCDINLSGCSLGHKALAALFNSLPTIPSAKTLTLTGNPGVAELTSAEKAVATGKGWTLVL